MIAGEIFYYGVNRFFEQIMSKVDTSKSPEVRLRIFVDAALETIAENRDFFKLYLEFMTKDADSPSVKKMATTFYDRYTETLKEIIQEGIRSGEFRDVDAEKLARAIYFLSIGVLFARYAMKLDFDVQEQSNFQITSILESIKC
ncbi:MAG: TetR family transcriptional regulator C-terminal domain-containing protein [Desulfobacterota bacterium]|nr:TetR family transcriptional regulator C-terminal domain-containing protein [Thermodesulfobacteriota bacterium]